MKVVFLCGGAGKRMKPITEDKFLLKFMGRTLLERHIEMAKDAGAKRFLFICNPQNVERIKDIARRKKLSAEFAIQREAKGMADALLSAKKKLFEEFLVVSPHDVVEPAAYKAVLTARKKDGRKPAAAYITGAVVENYFPGGYLIVSRADEMSGIVEKPGEGKEPSRLVNIVMHLHTKPRELINLLETTKSERDDVYERALDRMIKEKGMRLKAVRYSGFWSSIKYPWHIYDIAAYFMAQVKKPQISRKAAIAKSAVVEGPVMVEDDVKIMGGAVVKGPAYIGRGTVIGNNALVREAHLGDKNVVGFSTEVARSYIGDGNWFHSAYVGDSIISNKCNIAAGTVLANWRFDGKPVRVMIKDELVDSGRTKFGAIIGDESKTGVNSCIMPGVKVGPRAVVGPGVVLKRDLEEGQTALKE